MRTTILALILTLVTAPIKAEAPTKSSTVAEGIVVVVVVTVAAYAIWQIWRHCDKWLDKPAATTNTTDEAALRITLPGSTTNRVTLQQTAGNGVWYDAASYTVTTTNDEVAVTVWTNGILATTQTATISNGIARVQFAGLVPAPTAPRQFYRLQTTR